MTPAASLTVAVAVAAALTCATTRVASAGEPSKDDTRAAYRWEDKNKKRQYGDTVPPEYAQQPSVILNKQGVEIGRTSGQRSPEQIAEDERRTQAEAVQKQHDQFLLTTYTSVKDIEQLRDERLSQLEGQISASQNYLDSLDTRMKSLQTRAMTFKPYSDAANARRMPDQLAEELMRTLSEGRVQRNLLLGKRKEQTDLRAQFQTDIDRFHALLEKKHAASQAAR